MKLNIQTIFVITLLLSAVLSRHSHRQGRKSVSFAVLQAAINANKLVQCTNECSQISGFAKNIRQALCMNKCKSDFGGRRLHSKMGRRLPTQVTAAQLMSDRTLYKAYNRWLTCKNHTCLYVQLS